VIYHFSMAAFDGWTEFVKMCGAHRRLGNGHHSEGHPSPSPSWTRTTHHPCREPAEPFAYPKWLPEGSWHVLATAGDKLSLYRSGEKQPIPGLALSQPMLWTVNYGSGRIFVTALGHDPEAMKSLVFISALTRETEWAATAQLIRP
jgi:hypothetical protein